MFPRLIFLFGIFCLASLVTGMERIPAPRSAYSIELFRNVIREKVYSSPDESISDIIKYVFAHMDIKYDYFSLEIFGKCLEDILTSLELQNPVDTHLIVCSPYPNHIRSASIFASIPYEILTSIVRSLDYDSLSSMFLVNKYFSQCLEKDFEFTKDYKECQIRAMNYFSEDPRNLFDYKNTGKFFSLIRISKKITDKLSEISRIPLKYYIDPFYMKTCKKFSQSDIDLITSPSKLIQYFHVRKRQTKIYACRLLKKQIVDSIMGPSIEFSLPSWLENYSYYVEDHHEIIYNEIAIDLVNQNRSDHEICNFLLVLKYTNICVERYYPMYPRIFVLISRLSEEVRDKALTEWLSFCRLQKINFNNALALSLGICDTQLIAKDVREYYILKSISLDVSLDDPELITNLVNCITTCSDLDGLKIGSHYILNFPPINVIQLLAGKIDNIEFLPNFEMINDFLNDIGPLTATKCLRELFIRNTRHIELFNLIKGYLILFDEASKSHQSSLMVMNQE